MISTSKLVHLMLAVVATYSLAGNARAALLGVDTRSDTLVEIDFTDGSTKIFSRLRDPVVAALALDPQTGILFGTSTATGDLLVIRDPNGPPRVFRQYGLPLMHAIEFSTSDNLLYGISAANRSLYRFEERGTVRVLGSTGIPFVGGMAYDPVNQIMYATDASGTSANGLYQINLQTGQGTKIGSFDNRSVRGITGLTYHPQLGLIGIDNKFNSSINDELFLIDSTTGKATFLTSTNTSNVLGLAFVVPEPTSLLLVSLALGFLARGRSYR